MPVLLPVLMWGCGLPLLWCAPPWLAPLLPVVPAPEPLPVPVLVAPVLFPEPLLVLLPVLVWGCGLPLLVPPWLAPLLPVVPVPEPVLA